MRLPGGLAAGMAKANAIGWAAIAGSLACTKLGAQVDRNSGSQG